MEEDQEQEEKAEVKRKVNSYVQYSGMGFQMIAVIGIFMFIGYKIDAWRDSDKPVFMAIMGMLGVGASLYLIINSLKNPKP
jgi:F0F1-type ATP synthase assembly protein I